MDSLLADWGRWSRMDGELKQLGYPSMSAEQKMRRRVGLEATPPPPVPDDQAEDVERVVQRLPSPLRDVLKQRYIWNQLDNDGARRCGVGLTVYRQRLQTAQAWVAGSLGMEAA